MRSRVLQRSVFFGGIILAALLRSTLVAAAEPKPVPAGTVPAIGVGTISTTVTDLDGAVRFYVDNLDFRLLGPIRTERSSQTAQLRLGDETIELWSFSDSPRVEPTATHSNDVWFQHLAIVVRDMDQAYQRLRRARVVHISSGPQTLPEWNRAAAGIRAFYFRDPDGHPLELIEYPTDKGQPRWQQPTERLFLGIDHTAIAVTDTERALRFYQDRLGFRIVGESENYGTEQEHLNGVFGSRVRITSLRSDTGPGVELLEYIAPSGGRRIPPDFSEFHPAYRETRIIVRHPKGDPAVMERDPDGHALRLIAE